MAIIRLAQTTDSAQHWEHLERIVQESGRDGDFIFSPVEKRAVSLEDFAKSYQDGLSKSWVIADHGRIYGGLDLVHRPPLKSCLHRATLMMGIERSHRGCGLGSQLMNEAIRWARIQPSLDWLQLFVFEGNHPARQLYRKFGFIENGTTPDMFRVHGQIIADISMVLKLR